MDYEKKYNEALERAKAVMAVAANQDEAKGIATTIFPELRESEDDRIKKAIVNLFEVASEAYLIEATGFKKEQFLSYLEKQKEQSHDGKKWIYEDDYHKDMERSFNDGKDEVLENPEKYGLQKEQKPAEWSEEDEKMRNGLISLIEEIKLRSLKRLEDWDGYLHFLKSLRPQPKQEWSKEDENKIERLAFLVSVAEEKEMISPSESIDLRNFIKSLRPRPSWKPSEEQMSMLRAVINDPNNSGAESCQIALRGIYEQLKKL